MTKKMVPKAGGVPVVTLGLLRGVRAGWMGRMPDKGCDCGWPALGRCRGAIEVSVVGTGFVSLGRKKKREQRTVWLKIFMALFSCTVVGCHISNLNIFQYGAEHVCFAV